MRKGMFLVLLILLSVSMIYASDRSDAIDLMKKCDAESKIIEISVKNFGDDKDLKKFEDGLKTIKIGKVKVAQSKYLDAKTKFNDYLELQYNLYKSLGEKYIKRLEILIDEIAVDLADHITDGEILRAFESANNYLVKAKSVMGKKQYANVINPCRVGKQKLLDIYKTVGKDIPDEYKVDDADNNNKIYSK